jgi:YVTN family beta-propeller protein
MKLLRTFGFLALSAFILLIELGCEDYYRPVANPIVTPGGQPQTSHNAWVVNYNSNGPGSTTQIDVSGNTNLAVNSMGTGSIAEAFPANSLSLYVANSGNDTVSQYLPTLAGAITTITLLPGSHPVALGSATNTAMYVLNSGANSACPTTGSISTILASTLTVSNTTCVGQNPTALVQSPANNYVYVLNQGDNNVSVFSPAGPALVGNIALLTGQQNPVSVTTSRDGNWVFIVTQGDGIHPGALDLVCASTTQVCTSTNPPTVAASVPLGVGPGYSVVDTNLNRLYVVNSGDNTVSVFDTSNVNVSSSPAIPLLATVPVGTDPIGVAALPDGSRFYVANAGSNDVTVVSANSFSTLITVPLPAGANPVWIASEPTSTKVYVADKGTSQTTVIQTSNNTVAQNIPAPAQSASCSSNCALQQPVMIVTQ